MRNVAHAWIEHTGELELSLEAASLEGLFAAALAALGELLAEHEDEEASAGPRAGEVRYEVEAGAPEPATLLAEWLSELAYRAETEGLVPLRVERIELSPTALEAEVTARRGSPPHLVKAVTYHRLRAWQERGGWRARVVLDV